MHVAKVGDEDVQDFILKSCGSAQGKNHKGKLCMFREYPGASSPEDLGGWMRRWKPTRIIQAPLPCLRVDISFMAYCFVFLFGEWVERARSFKGKVSK